MCSSDLAALALNAGRMVYGDDRAACARAFVHALATGAEGAMIAVDAPTGSHGLAKLAHAAAEDEWLTREDALVRLYGTRPLVIETARFGDGVSRIISIGEARQNPDGSTQVAQVFGVQIGENNGSLVVQLVPTQQGY